MTRLGAYNGHASLLPRWRGAAPIQRALMAGDTETGMMIMKMEEGLDTGPVGLVDHIAIGPDETAGALHDRLMQMGARLMVEALARLETGTLALTPQDSRGATYARKIDKTETRIDWNLSSVEIHNRVRGLSPFPGAWCEIELGNRRERLKILRTAIADGCGPSGAILDDRLAVACGEGAVRLVELQRAGGKPVKAEEFLRGTKIDQGTRLL
jgi:methionyl-tRNA formyltransferase